MHGIGCGNRVEQRLGVRMARLVEDRLGRTFLDDAPEVHHRDPVTDVTHHGQIVRDEEVGDAEPRLQVLQQVHHLGLARHVERAHRFVEHEHLGVEHQRPRHRDPLELPARQLAGKRSRRCGPSPTRSISSRARSRCTARVRVEVRLHGLAERREHRRVGIERRVRILEHDLDFAPECARAPRRRPG